LEDDDDDSADHALHLRGRRPGDRRVRKHERIYDPLSERGGLSALNTQLSAYYNVVRPDDGPNWQIRFQVQLMFPK